MIHVTLDACTIVRSLLGSSGDAKDGRHAAMWKELCQFLNPHSPRVGVRVHITHHALIETAKVLKKLGWETRVAYTTIGVLKERVEKAGGLVDTIVDWRPENVEALMAEAESLELFDSNGRPEGEDLALFKAVARLEDRLCEQICLLTNDRVVYETLYQRWCQKVGRRGVAYHDIGEGFEVLCNRRLIAA